MNQVQNWEKYLIAKQNAVISQIKGTFSLTELDAKNVSDFVERGKIHPPKLSENVEDYSFKLVSGPLSDEYILSVPGPSMGVSGYYDGTEVAIPIKGDTELYDIFMYGRFICPGLMSRNGSYVRIRQWIFSNIKTAEELKASIRAGVENLKSSLADAEAIINDYNTQFRAKVETAFDERKQELLFEKQRHDAANPWG